MKKKGFTLIETLIVFLLAVIILSIVVPIATKENIEVPSKIQEDDVTRCVLPPGVQANDPLKANQLVEAKVGENLIISTLFYDDEGRLCMRLFRLNGTVYKDLRFEEESSLNPLE